MSTAKITIFQQTFYTHVYDFFFSKTIRQACYEIEKHSSLTAVQIVDAV